MAAEPVSKLSGSGSSPIQLHCLHLKTAGAGSGSSSLCYFNSYGAGFKIVRLRFQFCPVPGPVPGPIPAPFNCIGSSSKPPKPAPALGPAPVHCVIFKAAAPVSILSGSGSNSGPIQLHWLQLKTPEAGSRRRRRRRRRGKRRKKEMMKKKKKRR